MFAKLEMDGVGAQSLHRHHLKQSAMPWSQMQSNRTCLYCLGRKPEHVLTCGHSLCETCIRTFGWPHAAIEYRYQIECCLLCQSGSLKVTLKPPTAGFRILSVDGGGVRGIVPLEFLVLLQNTIGATCRIQDLFDLAFGTSSGKSFQVHQRNSKSNLPRWFDCARPFSASMECQPMQTKFRDPHEKDL